MLPRIEEIRRGASGRPIFYLSGLGARTSEFRPIAAKLRTDRPIYGVEIGNLPAETLRSMAETAKRVAVKVYELQSIGPYFIIGYSFGGNLGIEVARQLMSRGQAIEQLVILDGDLCTNSNPNFLGIVAQQLWALSNKTFLGKFVYLLEKFKNRFSRINPFSDDVTRACFQAYENYSPEPFPVRIVFFLSLIMNSWLNASRDTTLGWGRICTGGVEVIPVACNHSEFFEEPYATDIAASINSLIID
jgi:thioesterase domain-containing protein